MNIYVWWLSRPAYVAGAAVVAVALYLAAFGLGWADDVDGTVWTFGRVSLVLASGVAAGLRDVAAPVFDSTPYRHRRLAPPAVSLGLLVAVGAGLAAVQAGRISHVPWPLLAVETAGMIAVGAAVGAFCGGRIDPGPVAAGVLALIVITDENGGIGPWLTAGPSGPHWAAGRTAWAVLAFAGAVAVRAGLRDPSAQQRVQVRAGAL